MHVSSKAVLILYAGIILVCVTYIVERKSKNSLLKFNASKIRTNSNSQIPSFLLS